MRLPLPPRSVALAATVTSAVLLAGCTSASQPAAQHSADACVGVARLQAAVTAVGQLSGSSTVGEVRAAQKELTVARQDLSTSLEAVAADRRTTLEDAWKAFDKSVAALDDKSSIRDALPTLQEEATAIASAQQGLGLAIGCPTASASA